MSDDGYDTAPNDGDVPHHQSARISDEFNLKKEKDTLAAVKESEIAALNLKVKKLKLLLKETEHSRLSSRRGLNTPIIEILKHHDAFPLLELSRREPTVQELQQAFMKPQKDQCVFLFLLLLPNTHSDKTAKRKEEYNQLKEAMNQSYKLNDVIHCYTHAHYADFVKHDELRRDCRTVLDTLKKPASQEACRIVSGLAKLVHGGQLLKLKQQQRERHMLSTGRFSHKASKHICKNIVLVLLSQIKKKNTLTESFIEYSENMVEGLLHEEALALLKSVLLNTNEEQMCAAVESLSVIEKKNYDALVSKARMFKTMSTKFRQIYFHPFKADNPDEQHAQLINKTKQKIKEITGEIRSLQQHPGTTSETHKEQEEEEEEETEEEGLKQPMNIFDEIKLRKSGRRGNTPKPKKKILTKLEKSKKCFKYRNELKEYQCKLEQMEATYQQTAEPIRQHYEMYNDRHRRYGWAGKPIDFTS